MAENEEPDQENPFSLKKFVERREKKKKGKKKEQNGEEEEDIFDIFEAPAPTKREKPKLLIDSTDDGAGEDATPVKAKKGDNPFSFKKFLKKNSTEKLKESRSSPDLPDIGLGDVSQPRTSGKPSRAKPLIALQDDDDDDDDNDDDDKEEESSEDVLNFVKPLPNLSLEKSLDGTLPDFLSDGAVRSKEKSRSARKDVTLEPGLPDLRAVGTEEFQAKVPLHVPLGSLSDDEDSVIGDNARLKDQLVESEKEVQSLQKKVAELQKQLKQQKQKEVEETAEMERVVQQVEANLVMATQRAVKAENQAEKLKQEVKALQAQNASLQTQLLQPADAALGEIRERAKYASQELAAAATTADASLRQLLGGVDKLKLLSQVLATVDKITTEPKS